MSPFSSLFNQSNPISLNESPLKFHRDEATSPGLPKQVLMPIEISKNTSEMDEISNERFELAKEDFHKELQGISFN
jgi:hypothetical protein